MVCCGLEGTSCATPNGEDCCGDQLCVGGTCIAPGSVPNFQAPFPCGQSWTYSHHDAEVRRALDFIDNGGATNGAPAIAALAGVATRHFQEGGAGNYIVIDHWGGWQTYYFHLQAFSVEDNTYVQQGQEVGLVGSTGASSGPHLHFEELRNGEGKDIWLNGQLLTPYPPVYNQQSHTSTNCP
jgi:murein DD-endopeptidase MepM/ murein hydrolase activator NlpD